MSVTVTQAIAATREFMDATNSARWTDATIQTALGIASNREWSGILQANPYYRFSTLTVTTLAAGTLAYTSLSSGSGDSKQNWYRILAITDGSLIVYQQRTFLADAASGLSRKVRCWYTINDPSVMARMRYQFCFESPVPLLSEV